MFVQKRRKVQDRWSNGGSKVSETNGRAIDWRGAPVRRGRLHREEKKNGSTQGEASRGGWSRTAWFMKKGQVGELLKEDCRRFSGKSKDLDCRNTGQKFGRGSKADMQKHQRQESEG